jgi:hypothetical protein
LGAPVNSESAGVQGVYQMSNAVLINSRDYDSLFADLYSYLENCSNGRGGCDKCPLMADCRKAFDRLSDMTNHYKLTECSLQDFKHKYNSLSKQLTFC